MAYETVQGQWIVTLRPYTTPKMETAHISLLQTKTNDDTPFKCEVHNGFNLPEMRGYCAAFDDATKAEMEQMHDILSIEPVQIYRHCAVQANSPWGLARISNRHKLPASGPYNYKYKATGEGSIAYVIDTGINDKHVEFQGRASKGPTFVTSTTSPVGDDDMYGHGTHVAGTIAGKTFGVAKKAEVVGVKVFNDDPEPGAATSDIITALEWVVNEFKRHGKPSIVNMSLGGGPSPAMDKAVASTVRAGVVVCVAAGNESVSAEEGSPSREPLAITVGATDKTDKRAKFSNFGKIVDIFAPGVDIESCWIGDKTAKKTISGTSMACPHVTGAVCCWMGGQVKEPLLAMPELLILADKGDITGLKERTINALLQVSDD